LTPEELAQRWRTLVESGLSEDMAWAQLRSQAVNEGAPLNEATIEAARTIIEGPRQPGGRQPNPDRGTEQGDEDRGTEQGDPVRGYEEGDPSRGTEEGLEPEGDTNADGEVDPAEASSRATEDAARAALADDDPTNDAEAATVLSSVLSGGVPPEVLEYFGGQQPTPAQIEEAVEAYNELNPSDPIENSEGLWARWMSGDASAQVAVEAVAPVRPVDWTEIQVGQGESVRIRGDQYRTLVGAFGDGFVRTQNVIFGAVRDSRIPASALAGALAVAGVLEPVKQELSGKYEGNDERLTEALVVINAYEAAKQRGTLGERTPIINTRGKSPAEAAAAILEAFGDNPDFQAAVEEIRGNEDAMGGLERAGRAQADVVSRTTGKDPNQRNAARAVSTRRRYEEYYRQYNNHGLALVAIENPKLAQQIFENPTEALRNPQVARLVDQIFLDAGYTAEQWRAQGDAFDGGMWSNLLANGQAGGAAQVEVVNLPDDAALEESMRNLWRAWFRRDPSAEELAGFTAHIDGLFTSEAARLQNEVSTGGGNPFKPEAGDQAGIVTTRGVDAGAQLIQRARESADYRRLYGRKPEYLSEEEYAQRFDQTARSFAGQTVTADDAVAAGMEAGDTNVTTGRLLMDEQVFDGSSTFRERMFRAAQVFRRTLG
jgi:hypothetical protein